MSEIGNNLKTLIGNYVSSTRPTNFFFATMVTSTQIQLDASEGPLPEDMCIIPEWLRSFSMTINGSQATVDNSLKAGDRVIVLQKLGGNKYLVLGRL